MSATHANQAPQDTHDTQASHDAPELRHLALGFADPVADAQAAFRCALQALAHPGEMLVCPVPPQRVPGLMPATAALLLALTDHETPVWWSAPEALRWLQFHTGAPAAAQPGEATFAVLALGQPAPPLPVFPAGSDASPERSATLLIELPSLLDGSPVVWSGPGLREPRTLRLAGLPDDFWTRWRDNQARFPSGVDVLFVCGNQLVGLPRTTAVSAERTV